MRIDTVPSVTPASLGINNDDKTPVYTESDLQKAFPHAHQTFRTSEGISKVFIHDSGWVEAVCVSYYAGMSDLGEDFYQTDFFCKAVRDGEGIRHIWFGEDLEGYIYYPHSQAISVALLFVEQYIRPDQDFTFEIMEDK